MKGRHICCIQQVLNYIVELYMLLDFRCYNCSEKLHYAKSTARPLCLVGVVHDISREKTTFT